jgi:hypothetical protein
VELTVSLRPKDGSKMDTNSIDVQLQMQLQKEKSQQQLDAWFGMMQGQHHAPLDRVHIKIKALTQAEGESRSTEKAAPLSIIFNGNDVFFGLSVGRAVQDTFINRKCQRR